MNYIDIVFAQAYANRVEFRKIREQIIQTAGPARGFGYTVPGALFIQVYGIFLSQFGYKGSCFSWILDIQFIDMN